MSTFDADSRDPGLAAERTDLAWSRSGLALLACGAAVLRGIGRPPLTSGDFVIGAIILGLGVVTWGLGVWRLRRMRRHRPGPASFVDLAPIAIGVAIVGGAAFVLAAVAPS